MKVPSRFGWAFITLVTSLILCSISLATQPYNTRVVLLGTTILGICGGVVGVFMLLRKRSLVGDVVGHASLPGIAIAFLVMELSQPGAGRTLSTLLIGATISSCLGVVTTLFIVNFTRVKEDAALAITLSIFYGLGISLLSVIQSLPTGSSAGLRDFIFGKAALMIRSDVMLIAQSSLIILVICGLLFKEFALLCFDEDFGSTLGWPTHQLDLLMMAVVVAVTVVGLQSVGLILVVAILIIPASAARFWSDDLLTMTWLSALFGGLGAYLGVLTSAAIPKIATGAIIVLMQASFFLVSLLVGAKRGILQRLWSHWKLRQEIGQQDLMRAIFELIEAQHFPPTREDLLSTPISRSQIRSQRAWQDRSLARWIQDAIEQSMIWINAQEHYQLTQRGVESARRSVRNHRMWELFLIHYADIAPGQVDRNADRIEHVLDATIVADLERLIEYEGLSIPASPHQLGITNP